MALRIEHILFILSIAISLTAFTVVLKEDKKSKQNFTKELVFTDTTFIEVDTLSQKSTAYSTYGVRNNAILYVDNVEYKTQNIQSLVAKKANFDGNMLYLKGDVILHANNGYTYKTQAANYNDRSEILNITAPYVATQKENIIEGESLRYHLPTKETTGTSIDAVLYTIEK